MSNLENLFQSVEKKPAAMPSQPWAKKAAKELVKAGNKSSKRGTSCKKRYI